MVDSHLQKCIGGSGRGRRNRISKYTGGTSALTLSNDLFEKVNESQHSEGLSPDMDVDMGQESFRMCRQR